jgi:hypothetical protein
MTPDDALHERLRAELPALAEAPGGPTLDRVKARARSHRSSRRAAVVAAAALAAAVLLFVAVPDGSTTRNKGTGPLPDGALELSAFAEGPRGEARPLAPGDPVGPDERVVFRARVAHPGHLSLEERDGAHHTPLMEPTEVSVGDHGPGGDQPLSWRPDRPVSEATYVAELCPDGAAPGSPSCATSTYRLRYTR